MPGADSAAFLALIVAALRAQIDPIERGIAALVQAEAPLEGATATLRGASSIAPVTAVALLAHDARLVGSGKKPIMPLVTVMRKIILLCNARLRDAAA